MLKKQKAPAVPKVKHDIFMECAKTEPTQFWKNILESCAYGQFPKGMSYRDGVIFYKKNKTKQPITKYLPENIEEAKQTVIDFLRTDIGFQSKDEVLRQQLETRVKLNEIIRPHDTVWKDIRAASTQKQIIAMYVDRQREILKLNIDQANQLFTTIIIGLSLGTILPDDIEMDRGTILEIENIDRLPTGYYTTRRPIPEPMPIYNEQEEINQTSISDGWHKYNQNYQKYVLKR